ncbi:MAG: phytanoyl-CoA dioxygenase family protein [Bacteroidetes bacterium]|nr:phytanoyl-CoA dioxygenase family protein [Bacteroidota bacterium]
MKYKLGNREVSYEAEGQTIAGDDTVLLHHGIDLTAGKGWGKIGYTIEHLFEKNIFNDFKQGVKQLLISLWEEAGLKIGNDFKLEHYHRVADAANLHYQAVEKTKLIPSEKFPVSIKHLEERISEICGHALRVFSPTFKQSYFHFRVIRPGQPDNNPLHRDVWVEENADGINLYIPIAGSNENSSLAIIPGSHHWAESKIERTKEGAIIHRVKFNVPAVTNILSSFEIARPNPTENQVLVFSPYLIHGGAINLNRDETRISMEVRLWKK